MSIASRSQLPTPDADTPRPPLRAAETPNPGRYLAAALAEDGISLSDDDAAYLTRALLRIAELGALVPRSGVSAQAAAHARAEGAPQAPAGPRRATRRDLPPFRANTATGGVRGTS